ncbi:MAG: hypothetical protein H0X66_03935 [Verrucomicrobia bacterium]|nr:hypothetical protein [Verrucomicrobiota bacterium]
MRKTTAHESEFISVVKSKLWRMVFTNIAKGNEMKVLIKNEETGLFLRENGQRTCNREEASDFKTTWDAISFCYRNNLSNNAIVIESGGHHYRMPIRCDD